MTVLGLLSEMHSDKAIMLENPFLVRTDNQEDLVFPVSGIMDYR